MLFNFGPKKNSKNKSQVKSQVKSKSQYNNSHFLKPEIHTNFSQDPDLAIIFLSLNPSLPSPPSPLPPTAEGRSKLEGYADLFTQTLKKLNLKKNLILFSPDLSHAHLNKKSKHLSYQEDQIIAMTEKTGGWLLRSSAGETYAAQHVLLILDLPNDLNLDLDTVSLSQNNHLLLQNLSTQGYLIPHEQQAGIKRSEIGASLSENPRISQKLFIWDASKKDQDPTDLLAHAFN